MNQFKTLFQEGIHPFDGLELEICFGSGDQMKVSLLFDSMEAFEKFGELLQPVLQEARHGSWNTRHHGCAHVIRRGA